MQTNDKNLRFSAPKLGIVTALPKEYVAVETILENVKEMSVPGRGAGRRYVLGEVPAKNGYSHLIALALLADMGNNSAAIRAKSLLEHFPTVDSIIMVGIAGGIPNPVKVEDHVRLGDIVVSNRSGVIQYDYVKRSFKEITHRHPPRPPGSILLESVQHLEVNELKKQFPWLNYINQVCEKLSISRPPDETDILVDSRNPMKKIEHPLDHNRITGQPRVFKGPIASANILLKDPVKRDQLRDKFGVKAVEMEGSGIADASWYTETGYLVVRGICDYCDSKKGDDWQMYAAIVAAAYTRALIEAIPYQDQDTEANVSQTLSIKENNTNISTNISGGSVGSIFNVGQASTIIIQAEDKKENP